MNKVFLIIFLLPTLGLSKTYKLSDAFMREMMCLHNMGEHYCQDWIRNGVVNVSKYRKIEEGCINGVQVLCKIISQIQNKKPTPIRGQLVALSEFGCASGNPAHCLILASINVDNERKYLKMACDLRELSACEKMNKKKGKSLFKFRIKKP